MFGSTVNSYPKKEINSNTLDRTETRNIGWWFAIILDNKIFRSFKEEGKKVNSPEHIYNHWKGMRLLS